MDHKFTILNLNFYACNDVYHLTTTFWLHECLEYLSGKVDMFPQFQLPSFDDGSVRVAGPGLDCFGGTFFGAGGGVGSRSVVSGTGTGSGSGSGSAGGGAEGSGGLNELSPKSKRLPVVG